MNNKSIIFIALLLLSNLSYSQQLTFKYDIKGLNPKFIEVKDSSNKSTLYNETINWIKESYRNPESVIKMTIQDRKVRIEGAHSAYLTAVSLGQKYNYDVFYMIEFEIVNDSTVNFRPIDLRLYAPPSQYSSGGYVNINLDSGTEYYNQKEIIRPYYQYYPSQIEKLFNDLLLSYSIYIKK